MFSNKLTWDTYAVSLCVSVASSMLMNMDMIPPCVLERLTQISEILLTNSDW